MNIDNQIDIGVGSWQKRRKSSEERIKNNKSLKTFAIANLPSSELDKYKIKKK